MLKVGDKVEFLDGGKTLRGTVQRVIPAFGPDMYDEIEIRADAAQLPGASSEDLMLTVSEGIVDRIGEMVGGGRDVALVVGREIVGGRNPELQGVDLAQRGW